MELKMGNLEKAFEGALSKVDSHAWGWTQSVVILQGCFKDTHCKSNDFCLQEDI